MRRRRLSIAHRANMARALGRYRIGPEGIERCCWSCNRWLPFTADYWGRRAKAFMGLDRICRRCAVKHAQAYYRRRRALEGGQS